MQDRDRQYLLGGVLFGAGLGYAASQWRFGRGKRALLAAASKASSSSSHRQSSVRWLQETFDPSWSPGTKQPPPFAMDDVLSLAPAELIGKYRFFISAFVPRPINLVSSVSADGVVNLSPFSFSGLLCHDPPTVVFSCVEKNKGGGDTLKNVKATGEFVTHIMSEWYLESANHTCGNFEPDVNEFEASGLTQLPSHVVRPPRCAEAALQLECRVESIQEIMKDEGGPACFVVMGRVLKIHVNRNVYDAENGVVRPEALKPMSRLGGNTYGTLGDIFDLGRPAVGARAADGGAGAKGT